MRRGNKVVAAIAVGALAIALGSGVARCAFRGEEPAREVTGEGTTDSDEEGAESEDAGPLAGTSWSSGSGKASLTFGESSVRIESPSGTSDVPYEVLGEYEAQNATVLSGRVFLGGAWADASFILEGEEGSRRLDCDALDGSPFTEDPAQGFALSEVPFTEDPAQGFALSEVDPGFVELVGGDRGALEAAVAEWARGNAPGATGASFDREAYIDYASGQVTATFTCSDPAATEVTVSYDGSAFSVWGIG